MPKIKKILRTTYSPDKSSATVHVILDDGEECSVFVGGEVSVWFDPRFNKVKAHVKWKP